MKNFKIILISLLFASSGISAYGQTTISGLDVIRTVYPTADKVEKLNDVWFGIMDKDGTQIGYALSSKPFTTEVKGYRGTTPVIVVMDMKKNIVKVGMLTHNETPSYVQILERYGFFEAWESVAVKDAKNTRPFPDTYTGATMTGKSLIRNVQTVVEKALANPL